MRDGKKIKQELPNLISIVLMVSFLIFIFAPMELYLSNKGYFFFGGDEMVSFTLLFCGAFFVGIVVFFLMIYKLNKKIYGVLLFLFWGVAMALYIQGNFLPQDYGSMNGDIIDWSSFKKEGIISVTTFVVIILITILTVLFIGYQKCLRVAKIVSICVLLVQMTTLGTLLVMNDGLAKPTQYIATCNGEMELSKDENFIILMLDSFDSQVFNKILSDENAQDYKDTLKGFTYYPDTVASFSHTDLAFPQIISGEYYKNECTYEDYLEKAYEESPLLSRLNKEGWFCGVYTTSLFPQTDTSLRMDNCLKTKRSVSSHRRLAEYMYKFVGFRYLPQPLKKYFWFYPDDIRTDLECAKDDGIEIFEPDDFAFYRAIPGLKVNEKEKMFHFYHIDGPHPPFNINADFQNTGENVGIYEEARGTMFLVKAFFDQMKELDVYDNSTIIIMADHGYIGLRQSPLLMVKGKGENHPFTQMETQISFNDLQEAYQNILNGANNAETIFDIPENEQRTRIYNYYIWTGDMGTDAHADSITEYEVNGNAWNLDNIKETGKVYGFQKDIQ